MTQMTDEKPEIKQKTEFEALVKSKLPMFQFNFLTNILGISKRMLTAYFNEPLKMPLATFFKFAEILKMPLHQLHDVVNPKNENK